MTKKPMPFESTWTDPDDAPAWTPEMFARAELAEGGKVIRPATGTVTLARKLSAGTPRVEKLKPVRSPFKRVKVSRAKGHTAAK